MIFQITIASSRLLGSFTIDGLCQGRFSGQAYSTILYVTLEDGTELSDNVSLFSKNLYCSKPVCTEEVAFVSSASMELRQMSTSIVDINGLVTRLDECIFVIGPTNHCFVSRPESRTN